MDPIAIKLKTEVNYSVLEDALTKAAPEMDLETEVEHRFDLSFRLGETVEEQRRYTHTCIYLRTKPDAKREDEMTVMIGRFNRDEPVNHFTMTPSCYRPKTEKLKAYLQAVLKHIKNAG
jgi:hypothetical protein